MLQALKPLHYVAFLLTVIGALNWGLIGLFDLNIVHRLVGAFPLVEKAVYILVGLAAILLLVSHFTDCKSCHQ